MSDDLFGYEPPEGRTTGMGGHHSPDSETEIWLTPPWVLAALGGWEAFDLDPCAVMEPRPWPTARRHFTRLENGLRQTWDGRVFLNPPYGGPTVVGPWMRRMADHGRGLALIFARTETAVFFETVWKRASAVLFIEGRLFFHYPDGRVAPANAGAPSCLVGYGAPEVGALQRCGVRGQLIELGRS
jgi:hypothetical protein